MINTKVLYAYMAGIVDGEGCISIRRQLPLVRKAEKSPRFTSRLAIRMCDREAIKLFEAASGHSATWVKNGLGGYIWSWQVHCKKAANLLHKLIPYLTIKRRQADLLLELEENMASWDAGARKGRYGFPVVPADVLAKREAIYARYAEGG